MVRDSTCTSHYTKRTSPHDQQKRKTTKRPCCHTWNFFSSSGSDSAIGARSSPSKRYPRSTLEGSYWKLAGCYSNNLQCMSTPHMLTHTHISNIHQFLENGVITPKY
ncbi:Hypothetical predicted protein [Octopus vulgaris]|uniref:Uncharacterized protein n=1 Tax=Octopus vulgaris TaxID=6645 RepID=A0AA36F910_OCTVU|nr:Hypothetical predicted protein [Octopus vulgaris]